MILLLGLIVSLAHTAEVSAHLAPCPLGGGTARVFEKLAATATGGYDSDFATYSSGAQWRTYQIASCDGNLFTLYGRDMGTSIATADQARVGAALAAAVARLPDPAKPEVWERYGIAAALYAELGRDDVFLGDLWLSASWTARDEAVGYYAGLNGPLEARALLDAGWEELKKPLSVADRKKVLFNLARVAHRGGWGAERDAMLAAFVAAGPMDERETRVVARFHRIADEVEPALQDEAIARYRAALAGHEDPRIRYLLADLLRRRGHADEARPMFVKVAGDPKAEEAMRAFAEWLAAH